MGEEILLALSFNSSFKNNRKRSEVYTGQPTAQKMKYSVKPAIYTVKNMLEENNTERKVPQFTSDTDRSQYVFVVKLGIRQAPRLL